MKVLGNEFKNYDILNDVCYFLKKTKKEFDLEIPLTCIIEYKGFRALCYPKFAKSNSLIQGPIILKGEIVDYK